MQKERQKIMTEREYDYFIIGSGFGGSVSALRLTEKGYTVGIAEMGQRFLPKEYPKSNFNVWKFLWMPFLSMRGIFRMTLFRHVFVLSGSGYGGGSLVYANTLIEPEEKVWKDSHWSDLADWRQEIPQFYRTARNMLGASPVPQIFDADFFLRRLAEGAGKEKTFYRQNVAVLFGEKEGEGIKDPYFSGKGPERTTCTHCGACMVGCRPGAKNTLDKNYLYLAEKNGLQVFTQTKVLDVIPLEKDKQGDKGYRILLSQRNGYHRKKFWIKSKGVIFSGGVLGSMDLLLRLKEKGSLPHLSSMLGKSVRTNAESISALDIKEEGKDMSRGVAIASGFHLNEDIHIQAVRYSEGSDLIGTISALLPPGRPGLARFLRWLLLNLRHPRRAMDLFFPFGFAKRTLILLIMRTVESKLQLRLRRPWFFPFRKILSSRGKKISAYIPEVDQLLARERRRGIVVKATLPEILFDIPTTAHILGGAPMAERVEEGVINHKHEVFGYKNMLICDASVISANLGVNPSLTITALSERAISFIPPKAS